MTGKIELEIEDITAEETEKYREIFMVLAASGTLKLKGVNVIIHLDKDNVFQGIEIDNYWPWRRRIGGTGLDNKLN